MMPAVRASSPGFTLLELAIGLAVLAILSALAVPNFGANLQRQRAQGAAEALAADVAEARFEAARRGLPLYVSGHAGKDWCWAVSTAADCPCGQAHPAACQLRGAKAADHRGVLLLNDIALRLQADGTAQSPQTTVLESARGDRLRVEVSALGRARVCAEKGSFSRLLACSG
jgi:type IV fimbrial biogenesis protein FimT